MSVVNWVLGHLPGILAVLLIGGVVGMVADGAYAWLFDDDDWETNTLVVGGITLSVVLPLIAHMLHRSSLEGAEPDS
jgi:hypothetical protein